MNVPDPLKLVTIRTEPTQLYRLVVEGGHDIGEIYREIDGYFIFTPAPVHHGCWDSALLRIIADLLDDLNREWDEQVNADLARLVRKTA